MQSVLISLVKLFYENWSLFKGSAKRLTRAALGSPAERAALGGGGGEYLRSTVNTSKSLVGDERASAQCTCAAMRGYL